MKIDQEIRHLFVYGTLLKEYPVSSPIDITEHANFIGKGIVKGRLYLISDYPGLTVDGVNDKVSGEVYEMEIPEITLPVMDKYEEYIYGDDENSEYVRDVTEVYLDNGQKIKAWTYYYNYPVDEDKRISSGDFLETLNDDIKQYR